MGLIAYLRIIKNEVLWQSDKSPQKHESLGLTGFGYFKLKLRSESKDKDWTLKSQKADVTYVAVDSMDEMQWQSKELRVLMFEKTSRLRIC